MRNVLRFELFWHKVRIIFLPKLNAEKLMWGKAARSENVTLIVEQLEVLLNIISYHEALNLLKFCKESAAMPDISILRPLFDQLKNDIISVTESCAKDIPTDFFAEVIKLKSPRKDNHIIQYQHSRWKKLSISDGSSEGEQEKTEEIKNNNKVSDGNEELLYTVADKKDKVVENKKVVASDKMPEKKESVEGVDEQSFIRELPRESSVDNLSERLNLTLLPPPIISHKTDDDGQAPVINPHVNSPGNK